MLVKFSSPGFQLLWPSGHMALTLPAVVGGGGNGVRAIHSLPRETVISGLGPGACALEGHQGSGV